MKVFVIMIFFMSNLLLANTLQDSSTKKEKDIQLIYNIGKKYYKDKNFKTSYRLLSKIYKQKLMDSKFNFIFGRSAYETKHYTMALASFERVEMAEPSNIRVKLEMGRVYFTLKMYDDAKLKFEDILNNQNIPQNIKTNIELYLTKISSINKQSFTYGILNINKFYDNNINYGSLDDRYNIGTISLPTQDEIAGSGFEVSGSIINIHDIGDKNGYAIKNSLSFYMKKHSNSDNYLYNIGYLSYTPSLLYKTNKYTTEIELCISTLSIASKSYLNIYFLKPKFEFIHNKKLKSLMYFKYTDKRHKQNDKRNLDANQYEISYGLQNILNSYSLLQTDISYLKQVKKLGTRVDIDYTEHKLNLNYKNQLNKNYSFNLYGELKERIYKDYSNLFDSTRKDYSKTISATLNIQILKNFKFNFKTLYNRVNSNQSVFSYDKNIISIGITKTF